MPFFSIIIPLFNKEKHIQKTIESVINQIFTDFELLIINDGSTDNSLKIVEQFDDTRITIISQENKGVSIARNTGIKKSIANYIAFIDADDYWLENHLEELYKLCLENSNCGLFCSRYNIKIAENKFEKVSFKNEINEDYKGIIHDFFKSNLNNRIATASSVVVKKNVFDVVGLFNHKYSIGEDTDMWIRIAIQFNVAITNKITSIYNFNANNISKSSINKQFLSNFKEFKEFENKNSSLKHFLDVSRVEYALKYKTVGNIIKCEEYLQDVNKNIISNKTKILLFLPPKILQILLKLKHFARKNGFNFSVYQ